MYKNLAALVLASSSPRRRELLSRLGIEFTVLASGLREDEELPGSPGVCAQEWAWRKAAAVAARVGPGDDRWYLGVDTVVIIDCRVLGKPGSRDEARSFLGLLSGAWHEVISGYCLWHPGSGRRVQNQVSSRVLIKELEPGEIEAYLDTGEPLDKAGAYAVQGTGAFMVERIEGSYTNVVGLPLTEVVSDLVRLDVIALAGG